MPSQTVAQETKQGLLNFLQSKNMVKNTIRLSISTLCHIRGLFDPDAFKERNYCQVPMFVLNPRANEDGSLRDKEARQLVSWLDHGAFKALEDGYLQRIIFNILSANPAKDKDAVVLESYSFKVTSSGEDGNGSGVSIELDGTTKDGSIDANAAHSTKGHNGTTRSMKSSVRLIAPNPSTAQSSVTKDELRRSVQQMVKRLVLVTNNLEALPRNSWLTMQLTYVDGTPAEYQPEHFQDTAGLNIPSNELSPASFKLGELSSGFHTLMVKLRTSDSANVADADAIVVQKQQPQHELAAQCTALAPVAEVPYNASAAKENVDSHTKYEAQIDKKHRDIKHRDIPRSTKPISTVTRAKRAMSAVVVKENPQTLDEALRDLQLDRPEAKRLAAKFMAAKEEVTNVLNSVRIESKSKSDKQEPPMQLSQDSVFSTRENSRPGRKLSVTARPLKVRVRQRSAMSDEDQNPRKRVR